MKKETVNFINEKTWKRIKIYSVLMALGLVVITASSLFSYFNLHQQLEDSEMRLNELEQFVGYLPSQNDVNAEENREEKAAAFLKSDYVQENSLDSNTQKTDLFSLPYDEYYVLFYMDGCTHCIEVESKLDAYLNKDGHLPMYFYDTANINAGKTDIHWADAQQEPNYTPTVENFELLGTPTMLKIVNGEATAFIGSDGIISELNL